jgi:hypothetical protein
MPDKRQVIGGLALLAVAAGVIAYRAQESDAEFSAGEACRIYRLVVQEVSSRSIEGSHIDGLARALTNAAGAADDASRQDSKFASLDKAMGLWASGADGWVTLHNLRDGSVDPADAAMAEQQYGAMSVTRQAVGEECENAPLHRNTT